MKRNASDALALVVCLAACFGAAAIGSVFTMTAVRTWYAEIQKPSFSPPSWLFGPVWTILYAMMAVAVWLVWQQADTRATKLPLVLFGVQLVLNAAWSPIFFGLGSFGGALVDIVALWMAIVATLVAFLRVSLPAGILLVPYLGWVSFAAVLNFSIWRLNP